MNERPPLLIHRSTLVLILLAGGGIARANLQTREPEVIRLCETCPLSESGWPATRLQRFPQAVRLNGGGSMQFIERWRLRGAMANALAAFTLIGSVLFLSEWRCRIRSRPR